MIPSSNALKRLKEGNKRFVTSNSNHANHCIEKLKSLTHEQSPFAVILGCSDSRISPEIIFDQSIGDLFVIRNAGNIISAGVLGSIEYAVEHLEVKLIVVLGHSQCGAVKSTMNIKDTDKISNNLKSIINEISPSIQNIEGENEESRLNCAIKNNVNHSIEKLKSDSKIISDFIGTTKLKLIGANFEIGTGLVEFYDH